MDIKRTFIIFFAALGIFAVSLAYNLNLFISSRNVTGKITPPQKKVFSSSGTISGKIDESKEGASILSLTNVFSPQSGMKVPGKWSSKGAETVRYSDVSSEFKLSGTIISDEKDLKRAIFLFSQTKEEKAFREGDYIDGNTRLLSIERNSAILSLNGRRVAVKVEPEERKAPPSTGRKTVPPSRRNNRGIPGRAGSDIKVSKIDDFSFAVDESSVDYLTENINKVITQVRIIPYFESGTAAGFRLAAIRPGSAFSELGFLSGDVIKQINGVPLTSPEKIYTIFQNLKDEKKIEVDILRRGQKKTVMYEIR